MNRRNVFLFLTVLLVVLSLCGCGLVEITAPTEPIRQQATQAPTQTPTQPASEAPTQSPTVPSKEVPTQAPTEASAPAETTAEIMDIPADAKPVRYVLNTNTYKFHEPDCKSVKDIREENKSLHTGTREEAIEMGFEPCKNCNP